MFFVFFGIFPVPDVLLYVKSLILCGFSISIWLRPSFSPMFIKPVGLCCWTKVWWYRNRLPFFYATPPSSGDRPRPPPPPPIAEEINHVVRVARVLLAAVCPSDWLNFFDVGIDRHAGPTCCLALALVSAEKSSPKFLFLESSSLPAPLPSPVSHLCLILCTRHNGRRSQADANWPTAATRDARRLWG